MKVNFSTVLMDLPGKDGKAKPLRLLVEQGRFSADGRYIIKDPEFDDMTLGALVLSQMRANDEQQGNTTPMRSNFGLLVRIAQMGEVEITVDERDQIIKRLAKVVQDVPTFGAADAILNPQPKEVAEDKSA